MPCGWQQKRRARCKRNGTAGPLSSWPPIRWWRCGRRILPKAADGEEVRACLTLLSGRRHQVITAVALISPEGRLRGRVAETRVSVLRLSDEDIADYVESREGVGKAGRLCHPGPSRDADQGNLRFLVQCGGVAACADRVAAQGCGPWLNVRSAAGRQTAGSSPFVPSAVPTSTWGAGLRAAMPSPGRQPTRQALKPFRKRRG